MNLEEHPLENPYSGSVFGKDLAWPTSLNRGVISDHVLLVETSFQANKKRFETYVHTNYNRAKVAESLIYVKIIDNKPLFFINTGVFADWTLKERFYSGPSEMNARTSALELSFDLNLPIFYQSDPDSKSIIYAHPGWIPSIG